MRSARRATSRSGTARAGGSAVGFLVKKFSLPGPEPERKAPAREEPEPVIVHKPSSLGECLTVEISERWHREHLAEFERELRER